MGRRTTLLKQHVQWVGLRVGLGKPTLPSKRFCLTVCATNTTFFLGHFELSNQEIESVNSFKVHLSFPYPSSCRKNFTSW